MAADVNDRFSFDAAKYTVYKVREQRPGGVVVETTLPFCRVQLAGDVETSAFWMIPSPWDHNFPGHLGESLSYPINVEVQYVNGPSDVLPAGSDASGPLSHLGVVSGL
jgi:hypothetical protein